MMPHVAEWRFSAREPVVAPEMMSLVADVPANVKRRAMVLVTTLHVVGLPLSATLLGRAPATMQHVVETQAYCATTNKNRDNGSQGDFTVACGGDRFSRD
jgi:hypothetical protein